MTMRIAMGTVMTMRPAMTMDIAMGMITALTNALTTAIPMRRRLNPAIVRATTPRITTTTTITARTPEQLQERLRDRNPRCLPGRPHRSPALPIPATDPRGTAITILSIPMPIIRSARER